jgi:hypothetical protein
MMHLTFRVIEIADFGGWSIIRVQVESDTPDITTGDVFNLAVMPSIAALNVVVEPFAAAALGSDK